MEIFRLDPPADVTTKDLVDLLILLQPHIEASTFYAAPENVKRMFKPSVFSESPSRCLN